MANRHDSELTPQQVQQNGQSAISQDAPLRELHQEGAATEREPAVQVTTSTPELTDDEVAVLCDIEKDGSTRPTKREVVEGLIDRRLIETVRGGSVAKLKVTPHAFQLLTKRGVGLNES
jgi:hypothetical protein